MNHDELTPDEAAAVAEVTAFVTQHGEASTVSAPFPVEPLEVLAECTRLPVELAPTLVALLPIAEHYQDRGDGSAAAPLVRKAAAVQALGRLKSGSKELAATVVALLGSVTKDSYESSKDRDRAAEDAQDALALACVEALARLGSAAPTEAKKALAAAGKHRSADVRFVVTQVSRLLEDESAASWS